MSSVQKMYGASVPNGEASMQETRQLQFGAAENVKRIQNRVERHTTYNEVTHTHTHKYIHTYMQSEKDFHRMLCASGHSERSRRFVIPIHIRAADLISLK